MELNHAEKSEDLFRAQSHLYHHIFNFIASMSLKCAVQLGIADAIHRHKNPITLSELASALCIHPSRTTSLGRLMRVLVSSGNFAMTGAGEGQATYALTHSSRLLVKDNPTCLSPFVLAMVDPALTSPWHCLADWFIGTGGSSKSDHNIWTTPFEVAHGVDLWGFAVQDAAFNNTFNREMASDSAMMNLVIGECRDVFEGLESVVDVGGGTGTMARIIAQAFRGIKCTVLDLPHLVEGLEDSERLKFVGGSMFDDIPSADAILLKLMLNSWTDEDCVKVLKRCREAIQGRSGRGKVMIINVVITEDDKGAEEESTTTSTKLYFDMLMMTAGRGRERSEKEWEQHFLEACFSRYKVRPIFGLRSLIEVYPLKQNTFRIGRREELWAKSVRKGESNLFYYGVRLQVIAT